MEGKGLPGTAGETLRIRRLRRDARLPGHGRGAVQGDGGLSGRELWPHLRQHDSLSESGRGHRDEVVDCPPSFAAPQTQAALQQADLLLVPMQPSPVDLWAGTHVIEWVSLAKSANPRLSAWIVLNQVEPNTRLWKDIKEAMAEMGLPALKAMVRRRAAFRNAALTGATVYAI